METKSLNIPSLSVEKTVDLLSDSYLAVLGESGSPKDFPSVMLWGPPGVGKSQAVRAIAKRIGEKCGKRTDVTDVRLLLFNPIDLRGIPVANEDRTLAVWLKPKIFQMDPSPDVVNILFLDEISAAPQSVQAAAYQITLDRVVGEHRLPDNCIVIAAGNRVTDKSVSFKMPKALANRLLHIEIESSFDSWRNWAIRTGIDPMVLGYLSFRPDHLFGFDPSNDDLAFGTPRSWEMVSSILKSAGGDLVKVFPLVAGLVGNGTAMEFRTWCRVFESVPSMEDIFSGRVQEVPRKTDGLYAVISAMTGYARERRYDAEQIGNSLRYASRMPLDYTALLLSYYSHFDENYTSFLQGIPEYTRFLARKGVEINGDID